MPPEKRDLLADMEAEAHARFGPLLDRAQPDGNGRPSPKPLPTRTGDELVADQTLAADIEWLVPGLLARGAVTLIYGVPKSGKGSLLYHIAACVIAGSQCLTRTVTPCEILWLDLEQHERLTRRKVLESGCFGHFHHVHFHNGPTPTWERIEATLGTTGASILAIDSVSRFLRLENENDAAEVTSKFGLLCDFAHRTNVGIAGIHHARKGAGEEGREMRGSSAFLAACDFAILVRRETDEPGDQRRRLVSISRYDEGNFSLVIRREPTGTYASEGSPLLMRRQAILDGIGAGEATTDEIADAVDARRQDVLADLKWLVGNGRLVRRGAGRRGDPFVYSIPPAGRAFDG